MTRQPAEPITATAPHSITRPSSVQSWNQLTFLHWPYDPATVRRFLPAGVEPDLYDGVAWVGLVPFVMQRVSIAGALQLPYVSNFLETNVRTYGVDARGRRSVVFLSLDAARLLPVAAAHAAFRLPYVWSSMSLHRIDDVIGYSIRRRLSGARSLVRVRIGDPVEAEPIDHFHSARWRLHNEWYGGTGLTPVEHARWPLHAAELLDLDDELVAASGLPAPEGPPRVRYSAGVRARIGWPVRAAR
jgi:uncharacterized protein